MLGQGDDGLMTRLIERMNGFERVARQLEDRIVRLEAEAIKTKQQMIGILQIIEGHLKKD